MPKFSRVKLFAWYAAAAFIFFLNGPSRAAETADTPSSADVSTADTPPPNPADAASQNDVVIDSGVGKPVHPLPTQNEPTATGNDLGVGRFSRFPFRIIVDVRGGYDDNVFTSPNNPHGSGFVNPNAQITYDFGNARTKLSLTTGGGVTIYNDRPNQNSPDVNAFLSFNLLHKATARLTLQVTAYASYQVEPDFSLNLGLDRRSGNFFYTQDKFTAQYLWTPRFSTATSFTLGAVKYDDSSTGFYEDRLEYTFGNEFRFLLWPTTTLVAEYRFGIVDYAHYTPDSSTTSFFLGGFDHNFSPRLNLSIRAGEELRSYNSNHDDSSPYFESTLNYILNKRSSIALTAQYSIEEADVAISQGRSTFRTGVQLKYGISPRLTGTFAAYYQHNNYDGTSFVAGAQPSFTENAVDLAVSLHYTITRNWALELGDNYTNVASDLAFRAYSRNRIYAGVNFAF